MSGGAFDYDHYRISNIIDIIEDEIYHNDSKELNDWGDTRGHYYSEETIEEFNKGVELLKKAQVYAHRIDYLISGDDGEESFHKRLKLDLEKL